MIHDHFAKLDNPAWWALNGIQRSFATGGGAAGRYRRGILPFAAYDHASPKNITALDELLDPGEVFFLIGALPSLPSHWELIRQLPCVQMVLQQPLGEIPSETPVIPLTAADRDDMFDLINKVQPGYYERDTHQLGNYYGIRQEGQLVAIAGERIRLDGLTEVSAVCTDPGHTGMGYAQFLTKQVCRHNLEQGITPFLHTLTTNERAIRVYEHLGFRQRRIISFWKLRKG
ncbi:MAG TPA: GNAT family N-acetyltransferase [Puia sp.]|nr:GNAT family N-acetyltransferase [Puia sp.]